jgi:hypothetical protein
VSRSNNATLLLNWLSLKRCTRYQKFVPRHRNQWFHVKLCHFSQMVHDANCLFCWHLDENVTTINVTGTIFLHPLLLGVWKTERQACWPAERPDYCHHSDSRNILLETRHCHSRALKSASWDAKRCHWACSSQHFKGSYCLHFQGQTVQENVILPDFKLSLCSECSMLSSG